MATLTSMLKLSLLDNFTGPARRVNGALGGLNRQMQTLGAPLRGITGQLLALGAGYIGVTRGIGGTAGAAIEFESAFADVRKVVDASDEQFENMRRTIRQMSNELPIAATDIAALFAAAGESGVATTDLKAFSEMAARVGIAFDMSAGQAGESLAKLKTQLGLTVPETGELADAINHLSNNMASKAAGITDFMLRVGALAEMGGFAKEQIAAIGSAMIAAGAQSETSATAMQNVVKAMTRGSFAKKSQKEAAAALGLDLPLIARQMQKDAPKALKTVLKAIAKAPKHNHIALLSQFFGDEAKAFAPLIGNIELLDRALDSVSDTTKYAGSAYREYVERAKTTANVLQILRNRFTNLGASIGESMLPHIKAAAIEIGQIFDTLGERVTVFDRIGTAIQGFASGLSGGGTFRQILDDIKELFFGKVDGGGAADELGRVFVKFKEWGKSVREFSAAVRENPISRFMTDLAAAIGVLAVSKWARLFTVAAGIKALVDAVKGADSIGGFVDNLKKLSTLEWLGVGAGILFITKKVNDLTRAMRSLNGATARAGGKPRAGPAAGAPSGTPATASPKPSAGLRWRDGLGLFNAFALIDSIPSDPDDLQKFMKRGADRSAEWNKWLEGNVGTPRSWLGMDKPKGGPDQFKSGAYLEELRGTIPTLPAQRTGPEPITIDQIQGALRPQGTQDVRVTNPVPPVVNQSNVFNITEAANAQATAGAIAAQIGEASRAGVESGYMDAQ